MKESTRYINLGSHAIVLLCTEAYSSEINMILGHGILLFFILFKFYVFISFYKSRNFFPLKQRAPYLALIQLGTVIFARSWMYFLEWGRYFSWYDFNVRSPKPRIPYLRRFSKFVVKIVRIMFIVIFALRVMVVYANWKKDREIEKKKKYSIWKFFFNEKFGIKFVIGIYTTFFFLYMFILPGDDIAGVGMLDFITGDLTPFRAIANTWTLLHIFEILIYILCYYIQKDYPKEFYFGNETLALLLIAVISNFYYEVFYLVYEFQSKNCENGIISRQLIVDFIRYSAVFIAILRSERLVYHGVPPPPAGCMESLDIVMIANKEFPKVFYKFLEQKHPKKLYLFEEILNIFINSHETSTEKGYFSYIYAKLEPLYEDYKKTRSYDELYRRMAVAEKVSYNIYLEEDEDVFSGLVYEDGTLGIQYESEYFHEGVVKKTIEQETTLIKSKKVRKKTFFIDAAKSVVSWGANLSKKGGPEEVYESFD